MVQCTSCGCCWEAESGYYFSKGVLQMPCRECRKDAASIRYLNKRERILAARQETYYTDHAGSKAYFKEYRRNQRAQATA